MSKDKAVKSKVAAAAVTASLLSVVGGTAHANEFKTISKSSKAGDQVVEHSAGTFVVKCAGAAKGAENDCGALDGSHPCAGQSPADVHNSLNEWVYLTLNECAEHPEGKFILKGENGTVLMSKSEFQFKLVTE